MKFLVDSMLGKLNTWLEILGHDCLYFRRDSTGFKSKRNLIYRSLQENRIIITRDTTLSKKQALKLVFIESDLLSEQLKQLIRELNLSVDEKDIFSRCLLCNNLLEKIDKKKIKHMVPEHVYETEDSFSVCSLCQKIYWKGTHWELVKKKLKELLA